MKSSVLGKNISSIEVQNISARGIWLYVKGAEYFLPYQEYPWFMNARVSEICNVHMLHSSHLHWPDLDVDLEVESLKNPDHYPLVFKDSSHSRFES